MIGQHEAKKGVSGRLAPNPDATVIDVPVVPGLAPFAEVVPATVVWRKSSTNRRT